MVYVGGGGVNGNYWCELWVCCACCPGLTCGSRVLDQGLQQCLVVGRGGGGLDLDLYGLI
jgi:hypothetical protein